jgi:hypothetical protein
MRPLNASEAISPALDRAKDLLARPFRWSTFFKIAAVAFFAELGGGSFNFSTPGRGGSGAIHALPPAMLAFIVAFAVILGLVFMVISLILFYIGSRLQLVLVELVATRQTFVSPVWRRVSQSTWRWIGLKVLYFLAAILLLGVLALPVIFYFVSHHSLPSFDSFHIAEIILFVAAAIVVVLIIAVTYSLLRDFTLPFIALEDLSISESLRRLLYMLSAEPGAFALFILLRFILIIIFAIAAEVCIAIVVLISLIPFAIVGGGLWIALHNSGTGGTIALIGCAVVAGLIFLAWLAVLGISALGSVYTFSQAYSLYFLGGRYPLLGDLLDRSTPPPSFAYPAGFPPPSYPPPQAGPPAQSS